MSATSVSRARWIGRGRPPRHQLQSDRGAAADQVGGDHAILRCAVLGHPAAQGQVGDMGAGQSVGASVRAGREKPRPGDRRRRAVGPPEPDQAIMQRRGHFSPMALTEKATHYCSARR